MSASRTRTAFTTTNETIALEGLISTRAEPTEAPAENPYRMQMFTEGGLHKATNQYHRFDKQQNAAENKAFALTALNNIKQAQRQAVYDTHIEYGTHTLSARELQSTIQQKNGANTDFNTMTSELQVQ